MTKYEEFLARIVARKKGKENVIVTDIGLPFTSIESYMYAKYTSNEIVDACIIHWYDAIEQQFIDKENGI